MMEIRGKLIRKMKPMETVFHGYTWNNILDALPLSKANPFRPKPQPNQIRENKSPNENPEVIETSNLEDEEDEIDDKENHLPLKQEPYRKPELESVTLFDPDLLAAFQIAVQEQSRANPPLKPRGRVDPLIFFKKRCPPNGSGSVILYTTSLRGIRKTFEDCGSIRFLLESFKVEFIERDVSMHTEFKNELRGLMEGNVILPTLFIKGRLIGGAEEVHKLHEIGRFKELFEGIALNRGSDPCEECYGFRFVVCFVCHGSRRILADDGVLFQCRICNENGLIVCSLCC